MAGKTKDLGKLERDIHYRNAMRQLHLAYPNEDSPMKLLHLGVQDASRKWTMPLQNWNLTLSQLAIFFEGRLDDALDL